MVIYGQVIIGPPGSGKSTYCEEMYKCLSESGRNVSIINLGKLMILFSVKFLVSRTLLVKLFVFCINLFYLSFIVYKCNFIRD